MDFLQGNKTNLSSGALLIWAVVGMIFGFLETQEAITMIIGALGIFGIGKKIERTATPSK